jgi:8-oxo-dGTP pyrophosphatase MutT (NUDIX family)
VRCVVLVGDRVVVCENVDGCHPWPGGRREPGESHVETACREVLEETGWRLDPESLREIGWLHIEFFVTFPEDHPLPHPDILQVVYVGRAVDRDEAAEGTWTDIDGWELASSLASIDEALARPCLVATSAPFLELVRELGS